MDLKYWLVTQPKIFNFSWQKGETFGSSKLFPFAAAFIYLFLTYLLSATPILPSLSSKLLKRITAVHNMILLCISFSIVLGSTLSMFFTAPDVNYIICYPPNTKPSGPLFFWTYIFYLSKIVEFFDTLLIILGKSFNRLTFLHVYHHSTVIILCYIGINTVQSSFGLAIFANSGVHVVMYSYYLLCTFGFKPKWKKLLTDFQISQFVSGVGWIGLLVYYHVTGPGCCGIWSWSLSGVVIVSLYFLFQNFRSKSYPAPDADVAKGKAC